MTEKYTKVAILSMLYVELWKNENVMFFVHTRGIFFTKKKYNFTVPLKTKFHPSYILHVDHYNKPTILELIEYTYLVPT